MQEHRAKISENGRLVIPVGYRKALDLKAGDEVILRLEENELHISNMRHALKRAQKLVKKYVSANVNLTESLMNDRRKEAKQ